MRKPTVRRKLSSYIDNLERVDFKIIASLVMLNIFGLIMVYSASSYSCSIDPDYNYDATYLLKKQGLYALIGFAVMIVLCYVNYNRIKKWSPFLYVASLSSIILLKTPLGVESHNAVRWIRLGPVTVQIAEIVKIGLILGLAVYFCTYFTYLKYFRIVFVAWMISFVPAMLIYGVSNNLSSALILLGIAFIMTFILSPWWKVHSCIVISFATLVITTVYYIKGHLPSADALNGKSFRLGRIVAWLSPETYASDQSYQSLQSLYAVASGGLFGKGLGRGIQKIEKIPEAQNDMIFAVICEELGIIGASILILLFVYLIFQIMKVASRSENLFGQIIATGVALHIALQLLINVGVVLMVIPNTGVSLPFISYGGSAVVFTMMEMGLVLSINRQHMKKKVVRVERKLIKEEDKEKH